MRPGLLVRNPCTGRSVTAGCKASISRATFSANTPWAWRALKPGCFSKAGSTRMGYWMSMRSPPIGRGIIANVSMPVCGYWKKRQYRKINATGFARTPSTRSGNSTILSLQTGSLPYRINLGRSAPRRRHVWGLLRPGGIAFLSMPNADSFLWQFLTRNGANPYWGEIEHYHNFGRRRLIGLLQECGFEPVHYGVRTRYRACMEVIASRTSAS